MTLFFRQLSHLAPALASESGSEAALFGEFIAATSYAESPEAGRLEEWLRRYAQRLREESEDADSIRATMLGANPKYVLRNWLAQGAIEDAQNGDLAALNRLMGVLRTPFDEHPEHEELAQKRPEWARTKAGCATLSCSS